MQLSALMDRLGYHFQNERLLTAALTHPSYAAEHQQDHYQRLEFLGDAVLELAVSRCLYMRHPTLPEGRLTRIRAALVREESLFEAANSYGLGTFVLLSVGEERSGGREKPSILSDVMEALIGAVYLDGGFDAAFALVERSLGDRLLHPGIQEDPLDYKSRLQELLQQGGGTAPFYEMIQSCGPAHLPMFTMRVLLEGRQIGSGSGTSKRAAQQEAARDALSRISNDTSGD